MENKERKGNDGEVEKREVNTVFRKRRNFTVFLEVPFMSAATAVY